EPAITFELGTSNYRFVGIEVTTTWNTTTATHYSTISLGADDQGNPARSLDQFPMNIVFDRVYAHGTATGNVRRIFQANSRSFALIVSSVGDAHGVGADSQAVAAWNGPGPFKIVNNYLEGAGENVIFGGAASLAVEFMPSDLEFRCNNVYKPLS